MFTSDGVNKSGSLEVATLISCTQTFKAKIKDHSFNYLEYLVYIKRNDYENRN